jgi:hypothetical protein
MFEFQSKKMKSGLYQQIISRILNFINDDQDQLSESRKSNFVSLEENNELLNLSNVFIYRGN